MNYLITIKQIVLGKRLLSAVALCTSLLTLNAHAVNCSGLPEWKVDGVYTGGTQVQESGKAYKAQWWSQGRSPAANSGQWEEWSLLGSCDGSTTSSKTASSAKSSATSTKSSTKSSAVASSTKSSAKSSSSKSSVSGNDCGATWYKANLTNYESYPDPGSEECVKFNGCTWAGQFFGLNGVQPLSWVKANNIISVHSKDWGWLGMKNLNLRQGSKRITAKVYDECADSDCDGCCTQNLAGDGYLIDMEKYTVERFGSGEGIVEFQVCN